MMYDYLLGMAYGVLPRERRVLESLLSTFTTEVSRQIEKLLQAPDDKEAELVTSSSGLQWRFWDRNLDRFIWPMGGLFLCLVSRGHAQRSFYRVFRT